MQFSEVDVPVNKQIIHVAIVLNGDVHYTRDLMEGFRTHLDELFVGTRFQAHYEHAIGSPDKANDAHNKEAFESVLSLFPKEPDYLITIGTQVSIYASEHYREKIPIVFLGVSSPLGSGIVESIDADPRRGNIAGVAYGARTKDYVQFLSGAFPGKRFGYLHNPSYPQDMHLLSEINSLKHKVKPPMSVVPIVLEKPAVTADHEEMADIFFGRYFVSTNLQALINSSNKPFVGASLYNIGKGSIAAIGSLERDLGRIAAERIIYRNLNDHVALAEIPIQWCDKPVISLDLKSARKFGVSIDKKTIEKADFLIN